MANSRFGDIEATRILELLGNRKATVPVYEVYGIKSASTVEINPIKGKTKEEAWERWCEAAVLQGHVDAAACFFRSSDWLYLIYQPRFVLFLFAQRPFIGGCLDSVTPFEPVAGHNGTFALTGRYVAPASLFVNSKALTALNQCHNIEKYLLSCFQGAIGILPCRLREASGVALQQKASHRRSLGHGKKNYARAFLSVRKEKEEEFTLVITSFFQACIWGDLMQLQGRCMMDLIKISTGFCTRISENRHGDTYSHGGDHEWYFPHLNFYLVLSSIPWQGIEAAY